MSKLIDQGGFGCVFYPAIECDGRISKNPKYISKLHKKDKHVVNEYNIGKMITRIPLYEYYYSPVVNMCNIDVAKIDKEERDMCRIVSKANADSKFVIMKMPFIKNINLIKYLTNPNIETKEIVTYILDSYTFLLNNLMILNANKIIHYDLKIPNILIKEKTKTPIIIDFGLSIPISNLNTTTYSKYFYTYSPSYYIWPIDVHVICYVLCINSVLTREALHELVDTYLNFNSALKIFSESFIAKFKEVAIRVYNKYVNMSASDIVNELVKNCNTWDSYALSAMFLNIINFISQNGFTNNKLINEFSQLLLLNFHPDAKKRLSFDETKKRYNGLFSLDDSIEGYENILKNFDKKYFSEAALKETIHQEKITPIVMKKKV